MVSSIEKVLSVLSCSKRRREDVKGRRNTAGRRIEYGTGQSNYCEINLNFFLLYETMYNILCRHTVYVHGRYRSTYIYVHTSHIT